MPWQSGAAGLVFAVAFVLLALGRLGRLDLPRGAVALAAGLTTLFLLDVAPQVIDWQVILLIVGLLMLASLAEAAGALAGLRRRLDRLGPRTGLWACLVFTALASALILNDAAIVILVPFLLPELRRLGLPLERSVILLAVAANLGSLLTPFGNPQNAVLASAANLSLFDFLAAQAPIVLLGFAVLAVASWMTPTTARSTTIVPALASRGRLWIALALAAFLAVAVLRPARLGLGTAAVAAAAFAWLALRIPLRRQADQAVWRGFDPNVVALFVGLYLLTGGLPAWAPRLDFAATLGSAWTATALVTALSNGIGNVPTILTLLRLDAAWTLEHAAFLVTTSTLGGTLLLTGSAASLLAADQARAQGVEVRFLAFVRHAAPWVLPLLVVGAWLHW